MFYVGAEWEGDTICLHFKDTDGEHKEVVMNPHDAVDFELDFNAWMTRNQDRLFDAMRRGDQPRRKEHVE